MEKIRAAKLPGFYIGERGVYGLILGGVYICCFINSEDGRYDVTADAVDSRGDFGLNLEWQSYDTAIKAVEQLRCLVKKYAPEHR